MSWWRSRFRVRLQMRSLVGVLRIGMLLLPFLMISSCRGSGEGDGADYEALRQRMVAEQIESRGVRDSLVLEAMRRVPRHLFVPREMVKWAYSDEPLPIGKDQTISQPYIVALMTELLSLAGEKKVLEVGTGSGYQAAVLASIVDSVFTMEIIEDLAENARERLGALGYANVFVKAGDAYYGWPEHAPFDGIIVTAAAPKIPAPLLEQLAEGGKLVIPLGKGEQELLVVERRDGRLHRKRVIPVRFVPMTGKVQRD